MVVDCRNYRDALEAARLGLRPFVDGREIMAVWYVDTDEGLVRTFAIHQFEGNLDYEYAWDFDFALYPDWELAAFEGRDGMVSRTIRGTVELRASEVASQGGERQKLSG
jgi:hypothetical protein